MPEHAVVIAGGGPTGLMLAGELALARVDVTIVERRASQDLVGQRSGGLHSRTIEIFDQRGLADRFVSQGTVHKAGLGFSMIFLDHGVLQPSEKGEPFDVQLSAGTYVVEWHSVATRETRAAGTQRVERNAKVRFTSPFASGPAVLYLRSQ